MTPVPAILTTCTVVSASQDTPGTNITYTLDIDMGDGKPQTIAGCKTQNNPWLSAYGFDVHPLPVGSTWHISIAGDFFIWDAVEIPAVVDCNGQPLPQLVSIR